MAKDQGGSGIGTMVVVLILLFVLAACGVFVWAVAAPENFHATMYALLGASPDQYQAGQLNLSEQENAALRGNLTASQQQAGELQAQLAQRSLGRFFWWSLIIVIILIVVLAVLWWKSRGAKLGLTIEQAERKYVPIARRRYAFDAQRYPAFRARPYQVQRVKQGQVKGEAQALMYFLEFQFVENGKNRYVKGLDPALHDTITVAVLNLDDERHQQWFPFRTLKMALREAHEAELWGFAMQKESLRDTLNDAIGLDAARNVEEIKRAVTPAEEVEA